MQLGTFSISLAVKDLKKSKTFYEALGFTTFHGVEDQGWLIMKNGNCTLGLFQGMFEQNILTFNPGWNENAQKLDSFLDVRDIQKRLEAQGIKIENAKTDGDSGPGNLTLIDPDGNPVLIDQHV